MKLTESTDPCSSDRTFMGNEGFLQMFIWRMDCSQKIKDLLLGKFSID